MTFADSIKIINHINMKKSFVKECRCLGKYVEKPDKSNNSNFNIEKMVSMKTLKDRCVSNIP